MNGVSLAFTGAIDAVLLVATAVAVFRTRVGQDILMMDIRVDKRSELHAGPAMAWIASFGLCTLGDVMLGQWD
jgi:malate synthase